MAVVEETVFLIVDVTLTSISVAIIEVATALEVVDVIVAVLEVVVVKVARPRGG